MEKPWKIAFALLVEPWSKKQCLIIFAEPIEDARVGVSPTMMNVLGIDQDGVHRRFVVPINEFHIANLAPVTFLECRDIAAPLARIVKA